MESKLQLLHDFAFHEVVLMKNGGTIFCGKDAVMRRRKYVFQWSQFEVSHLNKSSSKDRAFKFYNCSPTYNESYHTFFEVANYLQKRQNIGFLSI